MTKKGTNLATLKESLKVVKKKKKTKTQHLKDLQENSKKNVWVPNHPKITNAEKREEAYLRDGNVHPKQVVSIQKLSLKDDLKVDPELEIDSVELKYGKLLGSPDQRKRHKYVLVLQQYLKQRCEKNGMCKLDLLKLWKGLWHCLYMADKVPVQDEISKKMAELLWCFIGNEEEDEFAANAYLQTMQDEFEDSDDVSDANLVVSEAEQADDQENGKSSEEMEQDKEEDDESMVDEMESGKTDKEDETLSSEDITLVTYFRGAHLASLFCQSFFETATREWSKIDKYRIDKFYTLMRYVILEIYKYFAYRNYNYGIIRLFNDAIHECVLRQVPNGIRLHFCDVMLDELLNVDHMDKVLDKPIHKLNDQNFHDVLEPFFAVCSIESDTVVRARAVESVLKKFILEYCNLISKHDGEETKVFEKVNVSSVATSIFELAKETDTLSKARKVLYGVYKTYCKTIRDTKTLTAQEETTETLDMGNTASAVTSYSSINSNTSNSPMEDIEHEEENNDSVIDEVDHSTLSLGANNKSSQETTPTKTTNDESSHESSSQKKKRKKKKQKHKHDDHEDSVSEKNQEFDNSAIIDSNTEKKDANEKQEIAPPKETKKKIKKKRKSKDGAISKEEKPKMEEELNPDKLTKKRKKSNDHQNTLSLDSSKSDEKEDKSSNNDKNAKKNSISSPDQASKKNKKSSSEREIIVISAKTQQDAVVASPVKIPPTKKSPKSAQKTRSTGRKVKINVLENISKSHKESMKALRSIEQEKILTSLKSPERSILLKKNRRKSA